MCFFFHFNATSLWFFAHLIIFLFICGTSRNKNLCDFLFAECCIIFKAKALSLLTRSAATRPAHIELGPVARPPQAR